MPDSAQHHAIATEPHGHGDELRDVRGGHGGCGDDHDWSSPEFVAEWLERDGKRAAERRREFALIRAVVPKRPEQEFRYLNLGAGPGNLDEVLLERFPNAAATLVDFSLPMLQAARERLSRFGDRVEYVQGDLTDPEWVGGVGGTFDFVFSTHAVHHLGEPARIRALYAEVYRLLGHGGTLLVLDYLRAARPSLGPLAPWAARDDEAGVSASYRAEAPGSLLEQLSWLGEAGFNCVDVLWKDLSKALLCGVRDHIHIPESDHEHGGGGHSHAH